MTVNPELAAALSTAEQGTAEFALRIEGLAVGYGTELDVNQVVWDFSLQLERGRIMGLAGESGCGKSTVALAAIGYRAPGVQVLEGRSMLGDTDLLELPLGELRQVWGRRVVYVAQQATTALNPAITVGRQMAHPLAVHMGLRGTELRRRQLELLEQVDIPDPPSALARFPFQFSGGQQQRIAIAIAVSCRPEVLILDEPTTGLDVTTQARFTALLKSLVADTNVATLYVSHDLALLNTVADRVTVMYAGQVAETGPTELVLRRPSHPYTEALLLAAPNAQRPGLITGIPGRPPSSVVKDACPYAPRCAYRVDACTEGPIALHEVERHLVRCIRPPTVTAARRHDVSELPRSEAVGEALLAVDSLWCTYRNAPRPVVRDFNVEVMAGETVGIVGESGSGKSTLLRAIAGLHPPSAGTIRFRGGELEPRAVKRSRAIRHELQIIFQNPDSSLNPRHTVESLIARPIRMFRDDVNKRSERAATAELLDAVKLPRDMLHRYPSELSGGQKQRVAIARAFAAKPSLLLCDEVTSALDVSVQATILELIAELSVQNGTAVIFVSHDLAVVRAIASRALVMRDGEVCEHGTTEQLFGSPQHPYTQTLLASVPELPATA